MKFKGELTGDYSPTTKTLRIDGKSTAGVRSKVEIPMESPADFFLFLGAIFRDAEKISGPIANGVMPMRNLTMGIGRDTKTNEPLVVVFDVSIGGFRVKFGAPVDHLEKSTITTIEQKLAELSLLMAQVQGSAGN